MSPEQRWLFFAVGFPLSVAIETPVLLLGLSSRHSLGVRLFAGVWLTACTYPVVMLVLPGWFDLPAQQLACTAVAETFAPVAECALFWAAFGARSEWGRRTMWRDFAVITLANFASFGIGLVLDRAGCFDRLYLSNLPAPVSPLSACSEGASIGWARGRRINAVLHTDGSMDR
jgi:hypothetical protein